MPIIKTHTLLKAVCIFLAAAALAGCATPNPSAPGAAAPANAAKPVATAPAPAAAPAPLPIMPFEEALSFAANNLFSKAALPEAGPAAGRFLLVIDPLVDGVTGVQSTATQKMEAKIGELVRSQYPKYDLQPFTSNMLTRGPLLFIGTFTPVDKEAQGATSPKWTGEMDWYRVCLALVDLRSGKIVSKGFARAKPDGIDHTPTAFFQNSPAWADTGTEGYVKTCQGTKVGDPINPAYWDRILAAAAEGRGARRTPADIPAVQRQRAVCHRGIGPADHLLVPQQRQRVVAAHALRRRGVGLEAVGPAPEHLEAATVPHHRVERGQQAHGFAHPVAARGRVLVRRPVPAAAVHLGAGQAGAGAGLGGLALVAPVRRAQAQVADPLVQRSGRQRRILAHHHVHQTVHGLGHIGRRRRGLARGVHANAALAPQHPQQAAVVHAVQQLGGRIGRAAKPVIEKMKPDLAPAQAEKVNELVTRIYEACNFQDITGQRITKVVRTLEQIDHKVSVLLTAFGDTSHPPVPARAGAAPAAAVVATQADADLLNGPQLPGKGISQADIDALFGD